MVVVSITPQAEFGQNDHREEAPSFIPFPRSDIALLARAEILSKKKLKQTLRDECHKYIEQFTYRGMDGDEVRIGNDDWKLKLNKDCTKYSDAILRLLHRIYRAGRFTITWQRSEDPHP